MTTLTETIRLGHSPDADDAFMFYALAKGKIPTDGLTYEHILKDIQTLNEWAHEGRLETTAISVHAFAYVSDRYAILSHGASMGEKGYGPIVVSKTRLSVRSLKGKKVGIPGLMTSAYLALKLCQPDFEAVVIPFTEIEGAVLDGRVDAGLLIHEGQLTHTQLGLHTVVNLGTWWANRMGGLPLPLGVNTVRKDLGPELMQKLSAQLKASIQYGLEHREEALDYALQFARGLDRSVADQFVGMYVNQRTLDLGVEGKRSIELFLSEAAEKQLIPGMPVLEFVA